MNLVELVNLKWPEVDKMYKEHKLTAVLPVGFEKIGTDYGAWKKSADSTKYTVLLPPIPYGQSGDITVREETLTGLIYDIGSSLSEKIYEKLIVLGAYDEDGNSIDDAIAALQNKNSSMDISYFDTLSVAPKAFEHGAIPHKADEIAEITAIFILGSTEEHGHSLPLGTDAMICEDVCKAVAEKRKDVILLSQLAYGPSGAIAHFPGTISITADALKKYIIDIGDSVFNQGVRKFLVANSHGGNWWAIHPAVKQLRDEKPEMHTFYDDTLRALPEGEVGWHANEHEASFMLFRRPWLVDMTKACDEMPEKEIKGGKEEMDYFRNSKTGVWGRPTNATTIQGKKYFEREVLHLDYVLDGKAKSRYDLDVEKGRI